MSDFKIDAREVKKMFEKLNGKNIEDKIIYPALQKGGKKLLSDTKSSLRTYVKGASNHMVKGIRQINDKDFKVVVVSIMRDFKNKFFELGTQFRKTKKGYNRGRITSKRFFKRAQETSGYEKIITKDIENELIKLTK